ncbi:Enoyl-CoA delta isomerase 2, mitochondrial [Holothuria leucospilota]|uniref:Enoyl-CoA delta isomerase 2, mitochondrial n=1 Tax=Holothuria leucospilota TaxID=206669 RepID=A0A9Q1CCF3_HOLLE|nr:Enoyl-CoA delta isomerase 2, mitochondrial [Holothuria leucospilota]
MASGISLKASAILRNHFFSCRPHFIRLGLAPVFSRKFHSTQVQFGATEADFDGAKERLNLLKEDPGNEVKLKIYALFKQATSGPCDTPKPSSINFVARAKWSAWNDLGSLTKEDAREEYIKIVDDLARAEGAAVEEETTSEDAREFTSLIYEMQGKAAKITLNRPNVKNALSLDLYTDISAALKKAAEDKNVSLAVVTGAGDYYCSGNDLKNFANVDPSNIKQMAEESGDFLEKFVNSFIEFPKPLIAAVNGPAIGVAVTTLGLFDVVYASDTATFRTPFAALGQSPEGCSSYIFPKIMGAAKANEVLLFGRQLSAMEAKERGLVTEVFHNSEFTEEINRRVADYSELPTSSTISSKNLIRASEMDVLKKVNREECDLLVKLWQSPECFQAIMNFFSRGKE